MELLTEPMTMIPKNLDDLRSERVAAHLHRMRRLSLYHVLEGKVGTELNHEELDIHFTHMPARYWGRVTEESVLRHLQLIRRFFASLTMAGHDGTTPIVQWQHHSERGVTAVEVCTWDRVGLLAKVAGAIAAVDLNIVRADIFTRVDNVVLDVFEVTDAAGCQVADEARLHLLAAILTVALRPDEPNALTGFLDPTPPRPAGSTAPVVTFDNTRSNVYTILVLEADDRVGLLFDIFTALAACQVNVVHAIITTDDARAGDVFYLTEPSGGKISNSDRLEQIKQAVLSALH